MVIAPIVILVRLPLVACGQVMANSVRTWSTAALFWKVIVTLFELNVLVVTPIISGVGVGVGVGVNVLVAVAVGVGVNVAVAVDVGVGVNVAVAVAVVVGVNVAVAVGVNVAVDVGVNVAVGATVAAGVDVGVGVGTSQSAKEAPSKVAPGIISKTEVT